MISWKGVPQSKSHRTNFGGHRHCASGEIMVLVYQVILQDHVFKGSFEIMGRSTSKVSYHPAKFGSHRHSGIREIMVFVLSRDLVRPHDQSVT